MDFYPKYNFVGYWLISIIILTGCIVIVGGITRLTHSGLSITNWKPITGILPPLNQKQWDNEFNEYKKYPEYQQKHKNITLSGFQFIYFWEYLHRILARLIGIVFLIPFVYCIATKKLHKKQIIQCCILFAIGALQGFMGWFMVQSGLIDVPDVSHYRLAVHLLLAFIIGGYSMYLFLEYNQTHYNTNSNMHSIRKLLYIFIFIFTIQVIFGAFMAGLDAGKIYNTWPLMGDNIIPSNLFVHNNILMDLLENKITIQFMHRLLPVILLFMSFLFLLYSFLHNWSKKEKILFGILFFLIILQFVLGIFTLVFAVPIVLGVLHQVVAFCIVLNLTSVLFIYHKNKKML